MTADLPKKVLSTDVEQEDKEVHFSGKHFMMYHKIL